MTVDQVVSEPRPADLDTVPLDVLDEWANEEPSSRDAHAALEVAPAAGDGALEGAEFTFDHTIATFTWRELSVKMVLDRFHEDRRSHELTAEVTYLTTARNGTSELLHRGRLNLGSTRARKEAAGYLVGRRKDVDWPALLELASWRVVDAVRSGRPAVLLRDVEEPTAGGVVIPPLLLANDPVILFGDGGAAKSYLGLALGMSVHSGTPYADLAVTRPLRTAYLDFEWQPSPHKRRMRALCNDGPMPDLVYVPCGAEGPLSSQVERLLRILHENAIRYVVVDSVGLACAGAPEEAAAALDFFQALTRLEVGSCVIAHINRSGDEERPFGSTFWHNSARMTWFLKSVQEPGAPRLDLALFNRKSNDGAKARPLGLHFEFEQRRTTIRRTELSAIPELAAGLPLKERIRSVLLSAPRTAAEIAERLDAGTETVRTTLKRGEGNSFVRVSGSDPATWALMSRSSAS